MTEAALDLGARSVAREAHEPPEPAADPGDRAERISVFTRVLRGLGAVLVVAAGSTFMLQHWSDGDNAVRYLTLLGMSLGLAGAGIFCGIGVKENRSARTARDELQGPSTRAAARGAVDTYA